MLQYRICVALYVGKGLKPRLKMKQVQRLVQQSLEFVIVFK